MCVCADVLLVCVCVFLAMMCFFFYDINSYLSRLKVVVKVVETVGATYTGLKHLLSPY